MLLDNDSVIVPDGVTFFDDFEYTVGRSNSSDPTGMDNAFVNQGGWNRAKAVNITGSHNGYLYTVMVEYARVHHRRAILGK
jgi:hypothetical protein